jgi:hypothetical protein
MENTSRVPYIEDNKPHQNQNTGSNDEIASSISGVERSSKVKK